MPFFADYLSRAQMLLKNVSNVIDLNHNKKIEGGVRLTPPPELIMKPDVRVNRVNHV